MVSPTADRGNADVVMAVAVVVALSIAFGFTFWAMANQIGPRWFWASDLCPAPNVTCGIMPAAPIVGSLLAAGIVGVGLSMLHAVEDASGGDPT